jgi:ABC-type Na+ transport system ATPase subunit NatA
LPDGYGLPKELTARQFLRYVGSMFGMSGEILERRINELLALFHLADVADRKLATLLVRNDAKGRTGASAYKRAKIVAS